MQIPDLLQQLSQLQDKNEKQADQYLLQIQQYLKTHSGKKWTPQHEAIFVLLKKRIINSEYYKRLFVGVSTVMLLVGLFIGARWFFSWEDYLTDTALMEMARASSLPLRLEQTDPGHDFLTVKIADNYGGLAEGRRSEMLGLLERFPSLGRHYDLGEKAMLVPQLLPSESKLLLREPTYLTPLGKVALTQSSGSIWPGTGINSLLARQAVMVGEPIQYRKDGQPIDFYLKVSGIEKDVWEISFSENMGRWSRSYYIHKTNRGDIEEPLLMVYEEGWQGLHMVAIGIGKYGEEDGEQYAWQVKSFERGILFGGG